MRAILALLVVLGAAALHADRPALEQAASDVIVVDAKGRGVDALKPADFVLLQDGIPQPLTSVNFVRTPPEGVGGRAFAIFLDEYHVAAGAAALRTREALAKFIRDDLAPGDELVVLKPLDSLLNIRLTTDRTAAAQAIATFEGRQGDYSPRTAFEKDFIAGSPARIDAARNQIVMSALHALATHLGSLGSGRKTLIVVSEGLARRPARRGDEPLPTLDVVARAANRGLVSIYPIDPASPAPTAVSAALDGSSERIAAHDALRWLGTETNGRTLMTGDDLDGGLKHVLRDSAGYYVLGWTRTEPADGRFHPIDVRVARRGLTVQSRRGYWSASPEEVSTRLSAAAAPRRAAPDLLARRTSPLIRAWFGMAPGSNGMTRVSFVWEPAPPVPGERAAGSRAPVRSPARVALTVLQPDGTHVFDGIVMPGGSAGSDADRSAIAVFELGPGPLRVQMSIEDAGSRVLDTDVRDVVVSGFRGPLTIGSAEVLRARNAREYNALKADASAAPVAARQFSRAERLIVRVPVYAPGQSAQLSARLLSGFGAAMRELAVTTGPAPDTYQIDLPLAALPSGAYTLQLEAHSGAAQLTDTLKFRVVP